MSSIWSKDNMFFRRQFAWNVIPCFQQKKKKKKEKKKEQMKILLNSRN